MGARLESTGYEARGGLGMSLKMMLISLVLLYRQDPLHFNARVGLTALLSLRQSHV